MLNDRRPILLANARILDPSRGLDFTGDLLIAEGVIRDSKQGIHAAGVPEGTEIVDCNGQLVTPGLVDMRAFIGEPGAEYRETLASASQAAAAGGVTTIVCQPDTDPVIDDPAIVDFVLRRARDTAIVHVHPMAALTKGLEGRELAEIGLLRAAGAVAFTDGSKSVLNAQVMRRALTYAGDFDALVVHHTEDPDLVSDGVMNEGEFAARLGLFGIPRAAETIILERDIRLVATARALPRRLDLLRGFACRVAPRQGCRAAGDGRRLGQSSDTERERYRRLSHLLQGLAAVARRGRSRGAGRGTERRPARRGHVGSQSAGCRDQAAAVRRGGARCDRPGDHARRRLASRPQRRDEADHAAQSDVGAPGRTARPAMRHAATG